MNRFLNNLLRTLLDDWLPPAVRDQRWLMRPLMWLAFGRGASRYLDFKSAVLTMRASDLDAVYADVRVSRLLKRQTALNGPSLDRLLIDAAECARALDVGCGSGYLAARLAAVADTVVGVDVHLPDGASRRYRSVRFALSRVERLPFPDDSFDIVVSTHTLEHVKDLEGAVAELRRVSRSTVVIVVPRERPFYYSLNLHLHFFPYAEAFLLRVRPRGAWECLELGGDLYYVERFGLTTTETA